MHALGRMLRGLHDATADFGPDEPPVWRPWFGRTLGSYRQVIGHCDFSPWNILSRQRMPVAVIDWETAGPVDALVELGQACWLNAQLHDEDVAALNGLAPPAKRAKYAALICDGYELPRREAARLIQAMIDVAIADTAEQAIETCVRPESNGPLWGLAWRARAAAWMVRQRSLLLDALS
ncbi:phosphotransferase [Xylophilus sp.]|uniref:phosphotransferase n=1 Tax=Xylophilus sp. TaxID=2653893 RepID=UPI0013B81E74|nr:phosphotransferase [Xylophilus sp.]KAF1043190.1 MAG: hypothetical protein GAK38_04072 [Xylophilus sp.]